MLSALVQFIILIYPTPASPNNVGEVVQATPSTTFPYLEVGLFLNILLILAVFVWQRWKLHTATQYISRQEANKEPSYKKIPVNAYSREMVPISKYKPITQELRRRFQVLSKEIDIEKTLFPKLIAEVIPTCEKEFERSAKPIDIAKVVYKVLHKKRPRARYKVKNNRGRRLLEFLPSALLDFAMLKMFK